jgi:hypothetical protein
MKTETISNTYDQIKPTLKLLGSSLRWTRASYMILSGFLMLIFLIGYVWWPLVEDYIGYFNPEYSIWQQIDWLLVGIFLFMSLMIMAGADLKIDLPILGIGLIGGLAIEGWGTQTELWTYYTLERPPLWIIPAWPIASLSIDRLYRLLKLFFRRIPDRWLTNTYWVIFPGFFALMIWFVWPTLGKSLTILALTLCLLLIIALKSKPRGAVLVFAAGAGLGYFLELWGTTRECWTYYTFQTPPLFAVLAHGAAAIAFWWGYLLYKRMIRRIKLKIKQPEAVLET